MRLVYLIMVLMGQLGSVIVVAEGHRDVFPGSEDYLAIERLEKKLVELKIAKVVFEKADVFAVVAEIQRVAWEADVVEDTLANPRGMPMGILPQELMEKKTVTMELKDVSLEDVVRASLLLVGYDFRVTALGIEVFPDANLFPRNTYRDPYFTRRYSVPKNFLDQYVSDERFRGLLNRGGLFLDQELQTVFELLGLDFPARFGCVQFDREARVLAVHTDEEGHRSVSWQDTELMVERLKRIVLPELNFQDRTVAEALLELRKLSAMHDPGGGRKGVSIYLDDIRIHDVDGVELELPKIDLQVSDIPLLEALKFVTEIAGLRYRLEPLGFWVGTYCCEDVGQVRRFELSYDLVAAGDGREARVIEFLNQRGVEVRSDLLVKCVPESDEIVVRAWGKEIEQIEAMIAPVKKPEPE